MHFTAKIKQLRMHLLGGRVEGKSPFHYRQDENLCWRVTEDEMVGRHLNGHEFEQAPGDSERQGSLECCSPWGCKESGRTERLNKLFLEHWCGGTIRIHVLSFQDHLFMFQIFCVMVKLLTNKFTWAYQPKEQKPTLRVSRLWKFEQ